MFVFSPNEVQKQILGKKINMLRCWMLDTLFDVVFDCFLKQTEGLLAAVCGCAVRAQTDEEAVSVSIHRPT